MLAILAPYDRSETTLAALRVADLAMEAGIDLIYAVSGAKGQGIHRYWDQQAIAKSGTDKLKKLLPSKFSHVISFGMQPLESCKYIPKMGLLAKTPFNDVIVQPYDLRRNEAYNWSQCQRIICTSNSLHKLATTAGHLGMGNVTIQKLHWASGDDGNPTEVDPKAIRFAAVCDSGCLREYPEIWLQCVDTFLSATVGHTVSNYLTTSLPRRARSMVKHLLDKHAGRFTVKRAMCVQDLLVWIRDHDFGLYPSCYTVFGIYPSIFSGIRMPFMACKVSPIDEMTPDRVQSHLVAMPACLEANGVDRALFDSNRWLDAWHQLASNPYPLLSHRESADALRQQANHRFSEFWRSSWRATLQ